MDSHPKLVKTTVLLADDHPMMLLGIRGLLSTQKHIEIVGEASDGEEAIAMAKQLRPDVLVMDVSMPGLNGFEATIRLQSELPGTKVIILSMHDDREYILQFLKCGAAGYVLKKGSPDELLIAIDSVNKGGAYFSPPVAKMLLKEHEKPVSIKTEVLLTPREEQVLRLIAKGKSTKEIADEISISARTVSKYREFLMEKLGIHSVAGLTQYAISRKLIEVDGP